MAGTSPAMTLRSCGIARLAIARWVSIHVVSSSHSYYRPLNANDPGVCRPAENRKRRAGRRYPEHPTIARQAAVQPRYAARCACSLADRLPAYPGTGRPARPIEKRSAQVNGFWTHSSFHNFADYALSRGFATACRTLLELSAAKRSAIMCSEAVWWRCHRRIVADYLLFRGRSVLHLMGTARVEPAMLTPAARPEGDALVYPAD